MVRYYDCQFIADEFHWVLDLARDAEPVSVWECERVEDRGPVPFYIFGGGGRRVDFNEASHAMIVASQRLADLMYSLAPNDIQLVPATVAGDDGRWWVVHVLSCIDCIDHQRSLIQYYPANHPERPGKPRGIPCLVLDPERIGDHQIIRPRDWEVVMVVSERIKIAMEEMGTTGVQFVPVTP